MIKLKELIYSNRIDEMSAIDRAMDIAIQAHEKQKRRSSGKPYIVHPRRVASLARNMGYNKTIQIAAMLHDVIEDANDPKAYTRLIKNYFGNNILNIVRLLSHGKDKPYNNYLLDLWKKDKTAFKVKMVDMRDNLMDNPSSSQRKKYRKAIQYISNKGVQIPKSILNIIQL